MSPICHKCKRPIQFYYIKAWKDGSEEELYFCKWECLARWLMGMIEGYKFQWFMV